MIKLILGLLVTVTLFSNSAMAQKKYRRSDSGDSPRHLTYDLGASSGSYNGYSYSEVNLGLNWYLLDNIAWRNSVFTRFGSQIDSALGLDTSFRYVFDTHADRDELGFGFFAGPGYRFSSTQYSGPFVEGGAMAKFGGLALGLGVKSIALTNPGKRSDGTDLPKSDTVLFIILAGGGAI